MKVNSSKSSILAKRLLNFLRITFIMVRKGLISKKKLIMDINLFFKRGRLIRKSFTNFLHLHHHHHRHRHQMTRGSFAQREYEFSCNSSPNPVFFHVSSAKRRNHNHHHHHHNHHIHLPCMNSPQVFDDLESRDEDIDHVEENNAIVVVPKTPEYTFNLRLDGYDNVSPGENYSPLLSPFPIMISDYLSEDENDSSDGNIHVDHEAEEFIKKFYDQLRAQSRVQLLQY